LLHVQTIRNGQNSIPLHQKRNPCECPSCSKKKRYEGTNFAKPQSFRSPILFVPSQNQQQKEKEEKEKEVLLEKLKKINTQAKVSLRFVQKQQSIETAMDTLLEFVAEQSGGLEKFLLCWYSSSCYSNTLILFLEKIFKREEDEFVEEIEQNLLCQLQQHYDNISPLILNNIKITHEDFNILRKFLTRKLNGTIPYFRQFPSPQNREMNEISANFLSIFSYILR